LGARLCAACWGACWGGEGSENVTHKLLLADAGLCKMIEKNFSVTERYNLLVTDMLLITDLVSKDKFPSNSEIAQCSVILRKWICENNLAVLAKEIGVNVSFDVDDTNIFRDLINCDYEYFIFSGLNYDDIQLRMAYSYDKPDGPDEDVYIALENMKTTNLRISQFKNQKNISFKGTWFSFEETIKFICNKKGGAHFGENQNSKDKILDETWNYVKFGDPIYSEISNQFVVVENMKNRIVSLPEINLVIVACYFIRLKIDNAEVIEFSDKKPQIFYKTKDLLRRKLSDKPNARITEKDEFGIHKTLKTEIRRFRDKTK
jgi:hypothetical protein